MSSEQPGSPLDDQVQDEGLTPGPTSGENAVTGDAASDDDEDDVQGGSRRRRAAVDDQEEEAEGDDLFGDEEEDGAEEKDKPTRQLDDAELDSGDDEGRQDRVPEEDAVQFEDQELLAMDMQIPRQAVPEPSDGEMYILKVPQFLSIEPQAWQTTTFQPPTTEHHSKKPPSSTFSAYNTALSTIRWRHSPSDPSELQSNARINRWSDGSLTLQLASDPNTQYEIDGNALAPPQRNPIKPTPISVRAGNGKGGRQGALDGEQYDYKKDSWTYLIVPAQEAEALRVAHKVTGGLQVRQTESGEDDAIEQLQAALAMAANATKVGGATGTLEATEFDPELQRKHAEEAERQQMKARKRAENAQERERLKTDRVLGRSGLSSGRYGGLNVGMLEDDEMEEGRGRPSAGKPRAKARRRRNSEYSEDEDMGRKRFTREDSYDVEDEFIAGSDEEEIVEDDDDPDDGIVESPRQKTPKRDRPRPAEGGEDDEDAEGEPDDDVPQARTKRRRIVDDEDEDE
ncbi:hypothetical protein PRZ48_001427 [Zasmidium cellare]|uniref:RNA polymerase-associated protein LEO1 n=1 Tax=Zasmidium cellare TaxID=395010 RepID=A0ABR0F1F6_ZASCE|nr:hypothetical protein PRZ48_001427 [Zasmidium cellare]